MIVFYYNLKRKEKDLDSQFIFTRSTKLPSFSNAKVARRIASDHICEAGEIELVLSDPNLYHSWENHNGDAIQTLHEITLQFPRDPLCNSLLNRNILKPIPKLFENSNCGIFFSQDTFHLVEPQLHRLFRNRGFDRLLEFQSILYNLAMSRNQQFLSNMAFLYQSDFHNSERIEKVYIHMKGNYARKLRVKDAAKQLNMSVVSFSRLI